MQDQSSAGEGASSAILFEDGPVVYPANAFDSGLRGDWIPLGSNPTKYQKKDLCLVMSFVGPDDCQLLSDIQIASSSRVLVFRGLLLHFQLYLEVGVFLFLGKDVLRQSRGALVLPVPKRLQVGNELLLEILCSRAGAIPLVFSSNHGGLVDDGVDLAHTGRWASVFGPAVARLFDGRVFLSSSHTSHKGQVTLRQVWMDAVA